VFEDGDHFPVSGGCLCQPLVRYVVTVPVVRALALQLRPIEKDALPGHAGFDCGVVVAERLNSAKTVVRRG
jgi:hypothetical protein